MFQPYYFNKLILESQGMEDKWDISVLNTQLSKNNNDNWTIKLKTFSIYKMHERFSRNTTRSNKMKPPIPKLNGFFERYNGER